MNRSGPHPDEVVTVGDMLRRQMGSDPDRIALIEQAGQITYRELDGRADRVAAALAADGVGSGDRIAFLGRNSIAFFELTFASVKRGGVLTPFNIRLAADEIVYLINDAAPGVLVADAAFLPLLEILAPALEPIKRVVVIDGGAEAVALGFDDYAAWQAAAVFSAEPVTVAAGDVAFQFYSSGTTGHPKGVMITHANCMASLRAGNDLFGFTPDSVNHVVSPVFHVAGWIWAMFGFWNGATNVLLRDVDPALILHEMEEHGVTHTALVPAVIQILLDLPGVERADFSRLELIVYGASPIAADIVARAMTTFGCDFMQGYGLTETTSVCVLLPRQDHLASGPNLHRLRAAGLPVPDAEIKIVSPDTREELGPGEVGEILVRSLQNMAGYWRLPEATTETLLPDGFLRTGDAGHLDEDGYLYIDDRIKDLIISGGENIYPAEIESALMSSEHIADVAVIGIPSQRWGETPMAIVVRAPGAPAEFDADQVITFARACLARYKCPSQVVFVEALPRNASGKLVKTVLREQYRQAG